MGVMCYQDAEEHFFQSHCPIHHLMHVPIQSE